MNNCLVTKLTEVVNNPNLPILEVMQQFTLNAIAASGNNSMTDAQKLALNHFFYQIGAIGNSGMYNKLEYIFLPMLASSVDKTLINYKGNTDLYSSQDITFSDGGIKATSVMVEIGKYAFTPLTIANFTTVSSFSNAPGTSMIPLDSTANTNNFKIREDGVVSLTPVQTYNQSMIPSTPVGTRTLGLSFNGTSDSTIFIYANNGTVTSPVSKEVKSDFRSIPNINNNLRFRVGATNTLYAQIIGYGITEEQLETLVTAVADLRNAFIS